MRLSIPAPGKYSGLAIELAGLGQVRLTQALAQNAETTLYRCETPGVVVKMYDLSCGKEDEVCYGPYMGFRSELANFEEVLTLETLRPFVPSYYGADIDYANKRAFIAMEYFEGEDLRTWSEHLPQSDYAPESLDALRRAFHEVFAIIDQFHRHGLIMIDFKPENVIRLPDGGIKMVDLGSLFTGRHRRDLKSFAYSATPDHAEVLIDASNLQAGVPPNDASDVFSAGVALFEMATGSSRLELEAGTADEMLENAGLFLFRDSQIKDVWRSFPHLKDLLPLVQTQLTERRILFAEVWHLLKAYLGHKVPDWESLAAEQQEQILLATGTTFIMEQLPRRLMWLAGPIAQATVLRSLRVRSVRQLLRLLGEPVPEHVQQDIQAHNCLLQYLQALELPLEFATRLNTWDVRLDRHSGHWAIAAPLVARELGDTARFVFLRHTAIDDEGHRFLHAVDESDADEAEGQKVNLWQMSQERTAWLGASV